MSLAISEQTSPLWQSGPKPEVLPVLEEDHSCDVCVVGLGGSGLATLKKLCEGGLSVIGIDAGRIAGKAAGANGGFLLAGMARFYHQARQTIGAEKARLIYQSTIEEIERMCGETPEAIRLTGSLRIATSPEEAADCQAQLEAMREDRLPVSPYFGPEGEGLLFPTDGSFNPWLRCRLLTGQVIALGANLYENTPALTVAPGKVVTPAGTVRCREVVVAVDGGLEVLMPALKGRVRTARLQMLATAPAPEVDFPRPVYARYGLEYWQQLPDGRIALGGFRDKGGDGEWGNLSQPSPQIQAMLDKFLRETLGVEAPVTHRWAAPVGFTENGLPVMEALEKGLWVMGGYCGTGNVIGAICGRTIAGLILDAFHSS